MAVATERMLYDIVERMHMELQLAKAVAVQKGAGHFYYWPDRMKDTMPCVRWNGDQPYTSVCYIELVNGHLVVT